MVLTKRRYTVEFNQEQIEIHCWIFALKIDSAALGRGRLFVTLKAFQKNCMLLFEFFWPYFINKHSANKYRKYKH